MKKTHEICLLQLLLAAVVMFLQSACVTGLSTNVSSDPRVASYIKENKVLVHDSTLNGTRLFPAGTPLAIQRIERIQGDGFVLFRARGKAFPKDHTEGVSFVYKWGHGGMSPPAPWERQGERLKKILGIEG